MLIHTHTHAYMCLWILGMEAKNTTATLSFNNFLQSKEVYAECKRKLSLVQFNLKEKENQSSKAKKK